MNLKALRSKPHLSISAINNCIDCGLLYKFSRVKSLIPEFKTNLLVFGGLIHRILQDYYQCLLEGYSMSFDEIQVRFEHHRRKAVAGDENVRFTKNCVYKQCIFVPETGGIRLN